MTQLVLGIDLGGTNIKSGLLDARGKTIGYTSILTEAKKGKEAILKNITRAAEAALVKTGETWSDVACVGIGSPGTIDFEGGSVLQSPNLRGLEGFALRDALRNAFAKPVTLENDANAAAFGEYWAGAARGVHSMAMLTLGTGIGGGIVIEGKVLHGAHGTAAELGHTVICYDGPRCACGARGCLEAYASAPATTRRFLEALKAGATSRLAERASLGEPLTSKDIYEAALDGDVLSQKIMRETGMFLGIGIVSIMNTLNPARFVLSGGMMAAGDMIMEPLKEEVKKRAFARPRERTEIVFASLGENAGFIGAAGCALAEYGISVS